MSGEVALRQLPRLAAALLDPTDRLQFRFTGGLDTRGRHAALLEIEGQLHAVCDRCGGPVLLPIDDAPDEPLLGSAQFDLAALIEDQVILALPISPRHEGCDSPLRQLPASGEPTRQAFAALAGLKKQTH